MPTGVRCLRKHINKLSRTDLRVLQETFYLPATGRDIRPTFFNKKFTGMKRIAILASVALMMALAPLDAQEQGVSTVPEDEPEIVINPDFQKYFADNSKLQTDAEGNRKTGLVVAEFRVNDHGVPSSIQIVSGFSRDANREVIDLLVSGPRWATTGDKRIRTVVEYK